MKGRLPKKNTTKRKAIYWVRTKLNNSKGASINRCSVLVSISNTRKNLITIDWMIKFSVKG